MPNRSRSQPTSRKRTAKPRQPQRDENQTAYDLVQQLIQRTEGTGGKNPLAVALGRLGGLKGGRARAAKLSKAERRDSALKAARARWAKHTDRDA